MAAQVNFFCFLMFFSVWLAIWCMKISTFVLIKVLLTYLLKYENKNVIPTESEITNNHLKPYRGYTVDGGQRQN